MAWRCIHKFPVFTPHHPANLNDRCRTCQYPCRSDRIDILRLIEEDRIFFAEKHGSISTRLYYLP